ncbi:DNA primase family protein [Bradyrhizobium cenepequi]
MTDKGNAERLQSVFGNKLKYLKEDNTFLVFDDKTGWKKTGNKLNVAKEVIPDIIREANECRDDDVYRGKLLQHAVATQSTAALRNLLAQAEAYTEVSLGQFDTDPREINCNNGVVNLRDKSLSPHSPDRFHLHKTEASYNPEAKCPLWLSTLDEIFQGDTELIDYIQVALGYSILGLTSEHCLFLCHGARGRNGKGTILETVGHVLGSYFQSTKFDTFLQKENTNSARGLEAVGNLKGRRFVLASEVNQETRFDSAKVKELTGGDTLTGGGLYKDALPFVPSHTIWLACNYLPRVTDNSDAMWSRIKVIPFNRFFAEQERRRNLRESLIGEADGILGWLIDGANRYLREGLPPFPAACQKATQDYRDESDRVGLFVRECLVKDISGKISLKDIHERYKQWVDPEDYFLTDKALSRGLMQKGFHKKNSNSGTIFLGYRLK